mgnify:CR=1 FL=1
MSLQQRAEQVLGIPSSKETLKPDQILALLKKKPTAFEKKQNGNRSFKSRFITVGSQK